MCTLQKVLLKEGGHTLFFPLPPCFLRCGHDNWTTSGNHKLRTGKAVRWKVPDNFRMSPCLHWPVYIFDLTEINFCLVRHLSFGFLSLVAKINPDYIKIILQSLCHCLNVFDVFTFHLFFLDSVVTFLMASILGGEYKRKWFTHSV